MAKPGPQPEVGQGSWWPWHSQSHTGKQPLGARGASLADVTQAGALGAGVVSMMWAARVKSGVGSKGLRPREGSLERPPVPVAEGRGEAHREGPGWARGCRES